MWWHRWYTKPFLKDLAIDFAQYFWPNPEKRVLYGFQCNFSTFEIYIYSWLFLRKAFLKWVENSPDTCGEKGEEAQHYIKLTCIDLSVKKNQEVVSPLTPIWSVLGSFFKSEHFLLESYLKFWFTKLQWKWNAFFYHRVHLFAL